MRKVLLIIFLPGLVNSCNISRGERLQPKTACSEEEYGIAYNRLVDEANDDYDFFTMDLGERWLDTELFNKKQPQFHIGLMKWQTKTVTILTDITSTYQQAPNFFIKK